MQKWFPQVSVWIWSLTCMILIFLSNFFSVKAFAESEFWFAAIKVFAIVAFIVLGGLAIAGFLPVEGYHAAPGLANFYRNGWFPNGFSGVFTTMLTVNFAFSGTELIGVTAGEAENPQKAIPSAIKTTLCRLLIFFIGSIAVMSALIPYKVAGVTQSPFVYVLDSIHMPFAANIMNFVVLTAIISAANSGLYASTRMLWSLSNEGTIPAIFKKTNKNGIPVLALIFSMLGGVFALVSKVRSQLTQFA